MMWIVLWFLVGAATTARESFYQGAQQTNNSFFTSKLGPAPVLALLLWPFYWLLVHPYRMGQLSAERRKDRELIEAAERSRRRDEIDRLEKMGRHEADQCLLESRRSATDTFIVNVPPEKKFQGAV